MLCHRSHIGRTAGPIREANAVNVSETAGIGLRRGMHVRSNLYDELKEHRHGDQERLRKLMEEIRMLMEAKKKRPLLDRLRTKRPNTKPKAWE